MINDLNKAAASCKYQNVLQPNLLSLVSTGRPSFSQLITGSGRPWIWHWNLATPDSSTCTDSGWTWKSAIAAEEGRIVRSNRHNKALPASTVCTHQCFTAELSVENSPDRHILSLTGRTRKTTTGHVHAFFNMCVEMCQGKWTGFRQKGRWRVKKRVRPVKYWCIALFSEICFEIVHIFRSLSWMARTIESTYKQKNKQTDSTDFLASCNNAS